MVKRAVALASVLVLVLSVLVGVGQSSSAYAVAPLLSDDAGWVEAYPVNNQNDFLIDQQTGSGSVSQDIVGDATHPSTLMRLTATDISFRVRVDNIDGQDPYSFKNFAFIGIDSDINGSVDFFLGAYNPAGSNGRIGIYSASAGYLNISPSTTGISGKPLRAYQPQYDVNYAITPADSNFLGDPDYFVSFTFPVADIGAALAGTGYSFTSSTPFRFMTGTAAQDNSFNQDINGMDKTGWSSGATWDSLGVFGNIVSADGTAQYYTVTFDKNTGDTAASPAVMAVQAGQPLGSLPSTLPTKRGMYFQEWNTMPDGSGTKVTAATTVSGNTTVYAIWSNVSVYTVTFNPNGGNFSGSTSSVTVPTINGAVGDNMPAPPTRASRYFTGWNTASNGSGTFFNSATEVTGNVTVYAQWANTANSVATFYDNHNLSGGSVVAQIYSNGNSSNFNGGLPVITRPGYTFGGWFLNDPTCAGTAVSGINTAGNYYAKWTIAAYTVTFNQNYVGAPAPTNRVVLGGVLGALPTEPTRTNYEFIEWNRTADASGEAMYPTSLISGNTTLYAIWKPIQQVAFDANGGQFDDASTLWSTTAVDGVLAMLPQPPSREDYSFMGWSTSASGSTVASIQNVTGTSTYYAVWAPIHSVTFSENYGVTPATLEVPTAYGSVLYLPNEPVRSGYEFEGWNTAADGTGSSFTLATSVDSDLTVYGQWLATGPAHTVHFEVNGGSAVADITTNELTAPPVTTLEGYTFEGWYADSDLTNKVEFPMLVTGETTLYAKWAPNTYTVTLDPMGGTGGTASVVASYGQLMPTASAPTRTGYTFAGYFDAADKQYYSAGMVSSANWDKTQSATLHARWVANSYVVTFDANGGAFGGEETSVDVDQTFEADYVLPATEPSMAGSSFSGWNTEADGTGSTVTADTLVTTAQAHTLYATWTEAGNIALRYAVANATQGGVSLSLETLNPVTGSAAGSTALPAAGFEFVKWVDEDGNTVGTDATFVPAKGAGDVYADATYIAVFRAIEYPATVSITVDDIAVGGKTVQLSSDGGLTFVTMVEQPDHSYTLDRPSGVYSIWIDGVDAGATLTISGGASSVEFAYYTLTLAEGTGISAVSGSGVFLEGSAVPAFSATVQTGYTWSRWTSSDTDLLSDQGSQAATFAMPGGAVTLTAVAQANDYTVTFDPAGGSGGTSSVSAAYGQSMPAATAPTRMGYTFTGYFDAADKQYYSAGMVSTASWDKTQDATLYARWTPNSYGVTFDANGGWFGGEETSLLIDQTYQSEYILPSEEPTMAGSTFSGWNTESDGTGSIVTGDTVVMTAQAHTVYAVWAEVTHVSIGYSVQDSAQGSVSVSLETLNPVTGSATGSTALPASGYEFVEWIDSEGNTVGTDATFVPAKGPGDVYVDATFIAVFQAIKYPAAVSITIDDVASGDHTVRLSTDGGLTFITLVEQSDRSFQASVPNGLYSIWIDGVDTGAEMTIDGESASQDFQFYTLTVERGTGVAAASGGGVFLAGATVPALTATVQSGYSWAQWTSSDTGLLANQSEQGAAFTMPGGPITLTASATRIMHTVTAEAGPGGSITPAGSVSVGHGDDQSFTMTPELGYHIVSVLVDGERVDEVTPADEREETGRSYNFRNVAADHTISVIFAADVAAVHTITVIPGAHGTITPGGPLTVSDGDSATFKIVAKRGYAIADVKVDGVSVGAVGTYTFQGVTEDHEIAASYTYVGTNPQTGDNTPIALLLSALALSLVGIASVAYVRRGYSVAPARVRRPRG